MSNFIFTLNTTSVFTSDAPLLELLVDGVVVSSITLEAGTQTSHVSLPFSGLYPSSISVRFNDGLSEGGRSVTLNSVSINGTNVGNTNISNTVLNYGDISAVDVTDAQYYFGEVEKTASDLGAATIEGTIDDDYLKATAEADVINAMDGRDLIKAYAGDDQIMAGNGDDLVQGGEGNDIILGEGGKDVLKGDAGDDEIYGGEGNDILKGGIGNDILLGGAGNDVIKGEDGDDTMLGGEGKDVLKGGAGNDYAAGGAGIDIIDGEDGNDTISGGDDNDVLRGGVGLDVIHGDAGNDKLDGGDDNDQLFGGEGSDTIYGGNGDDYIEGGSGIDKIFAGSGNDTIYGGADLDKIDGGEGDDIIYGGDGIDKIVGNLGDDTIYGEAGNDKIFGGEGMDTIAGGKGNDRIRGEDGDDTITGDAGNDWLYGDAGNDIIDAGKGKDNVNGGEGNDTLYGRAGNDYMFGNEGDDTIYGGDDHDHIRGGDGNDTLYGEDGNDILEGAAGDDIIDGGAGMNTVSYENAKSGVTVDLSVTLSQNTVGAGIDTITNVDHLIGSNFDDTLEGNVNDNIIHGLDGNDTIITGVQKNLIAEARMVTTDQTSADQWHTVTFESAILNPVIKMHMMTENDADPVTLRVRNVTDTGFEWQMDEWDYLDGIHGTETVSWLAVASGEHTLGNGMTIQAGTTELTNETEKAMAFGSTFGSTPVIFSQIMTANDPRAAVVRMDDVTANGANMHLQNQESAPNTHATETVGWIAIDSGGSGSNGLESGFTSDSITHGTSTINFSGTFSNNPVVIADMQGEDGADTANVRGSSVSNTGHNVSIEEEQSGDTEVKHTSETVGYLALSEGTIFTEDNSAISNNTYYGGNGDDSLFGGSGSDSLFGQEDEDFLVGNSGNDNLYGGSGNDTIHGDDVTLIGQSGMVTTDQTSADQWHTVTFESAILNPVIKMHMMTENDKAPLTLRVKNVTDTGFEWQMDEWDYLDGIHGTETVSWLAIAEGEHTLENGMVIKAGMTTAQNENSKNVNFSSAFSTAPVVFTQTMSANDSQAVALRNDDVTASGFRLESQLQESSPATLQTEEVGWIAIEAGGSASSGLEIGVTSNSVTHGNTTINFNGAFTNSPVIIADMQTEDGGDVATTRGSITTNSSHRLSVEEEQSANTETGHTSEVVGYLAMNQGVIMSAPTGSTGDDVIYGGDGDDTLFGGSGTDNLFGDAGNDKLYGNSGNDTLNGGDGDDIILGDSASAAFDPMSIAGAVIWLDSADASTILDAEGDAANSGAAFSGSVATWTDKTGRGNNAFDTSANKPTYDAMGVNSLGAIHFNANSHFDTHLSINASDIPNITIFAVYTPTVADNPGAVWGEDSGGWDRFLLDGEVNAISEITSSGIGPIKDNMLFDGTNTQVSSIIFQEDVTNGSSISVNGTVTTAAFTSNHGPEASDKLNIGAIGGNKREFDGYITEFLIYDRALSAAERENVESYLIGKWKGTDGATVYSGGDDVLYGGNGLDTLYGGDGIDRFVFEAESAYNYSDLVQDFRFHIGDILDISDLITEGSVTSGNLTEYLQFIDSGDDTLVQVDANGGGDEFQTIAQLQNIAGLDEATLYENGNIIV